MVAAHITAYTNLLELAVRLKLLESVDGSAKTRKALARNPSPNEIAHSRIQLEVAALAAKAGYEVELEPKPLGNRPADVGVQINKQRLVVETRVVLPSDAWREQSDWTDALFERVRDLERTHKVRCEGEIAVRLSDAGSDELIRGLEDRARLIAIGAIAPRLLAPGAVLDVVRDTDEAGRGLSGPQITGDSWARIGPRIAEKARLAAESGAEWLRLDALDGFWQFTKWGQMSLAARLEALAVPAREALGAMKGIVLTSGALLAQGEFRDEDAVLSGGLVAVRRLLTPLRVRETLIISASDVEGPAKKYWRTLFQDEPQWLPWALDQLELPAPGEIFAPESST